MDRKTYMLIRDNLLVTAGARAGYMDARGDIDLPGGEWGEDKLAEFIVDAVRTYGNIPDDIPFDLFIEEALINEFGKKGEQNALQRTPQHYPRFWFPLY